MYFVLLNICTCVWVCLIYMCVYVYLYVNTALLAKYRNNEKLLKY